MTTLTSLTRTTPAVAAGFRPMRGVAWYKRLQAWALARRNPGYGVQVVGYVDDLPYAPDPSRASCACPTRTPATSVIRFCQVFCQVMDASLPYPAITSVRCARERLAFGVLLVASRGA